MVCSATGIKPGAYRINSTAREGFAQGRCVCDDPSMTSTLRRLARRTLLAAGYRITPVPPQSPLSVGALAVQGVDPYGTHFVPLAAAVSRTTGPVLELGLGDHSTPLLHLLCHDRLLVSLDNSARWVTRYAAFRSDRHIIETVEDWDRCPVLDQHEWAVALVDCSPATARVDLIERLQNRVRFFVVHDTDVDFESAAVFAMEPALQRFRYRSDYEVFSPRTTVVSNIEPFLLTAAEPAAARR
jgi:hypothetical protein